MTDPLMFIVRNAMIAAAMRKDQPGIYVTHPGAALMGRRARGILLFIKIEPGTREDDWFQCAAKTKLTPDGFVLDCCE